MIPLYDVVPRVGGLRVVPGSHLGSDAKLVKQSCTHYSGDWVELNNRAALVEERAVLLEAKAGELIIWDSRLIHGGLVGDSPGKEVAVIPAIDDDDVDDEDKVGREGGRRGEGEGGRKGRVDPFPLARLSMTICMTPQSRASDDIQMQRYLAAKQGVATTHWPHEFCRQYFGNTNGSSIRERNKDGVMKHFKLPREAMMQEGLELICSKEVLKNYGEVKGDR